MADKSIDQLIAAENILATDLFVLQQSGMAKKLTGQVLLNWLTAAADGHGGIQSIEKVSTSGLADTYRITLADLTVFDFVVTNGRSVNSITKVSTSGLVDTYRIDYSDGKSSTFTVTNGAKGDKGDNAYMWIKYASQEPTASSHSFGDVPDAWIGVYFGNLSSAPADWQQYKWYQWKGEKGDTGDAATLMSATVTYQTSTSGTIVPSGSWQANVPIVPPGSYLWTRTVYTFNTGAPVTQYSVARFGIDGTGSVSSVAGISPDANGDVPLTAENVGALPSAGGTMTGPINMNGQTLSGLNTPTANDHAANMGYVNEQVKRAAPRNLLDNSDFLNPVNQGGFTSTNSDSVYTIDRWLSNFDNNSAKISIDSSGITIDPFDGGYAGIYQLFANYDAMMGKKYTAAVCVDDVWDCVVFTMGNLPEGVRFPNNELFVFSVSRGHYLLRAYMPITIQRVALYEGEYTAETLPNYQPKGYGVEVVNSNGGALSMELLWENASSTSEFVTQNIALDLSGYSMAAIWFRRNTGSSIEIYPVFAFVGGAQAEARAVLATGLYVRTLSARTDNVSFYDSNKWASWGNSSYTVANDHIIPVRIYGIRG